MPKPTVIHAEDNGVNGFYFPDEAQPGDLVIVIPTLSANGDNTYEAYSPPPADWTLVVNDTDSVNGYHSAILFREYDGVWTMPALAEWEDTYMTDHVQVLVVRGHNPADPLGAVNSRNSGGTTGTDIRWPALGMEDLSGDSLVLRYAFHTGAEGFIGPSGHTTVAEQVATFPPPAYEVFSQDDTTVDLGADASVFFTGSWMALGMEIRGLPSGGKAKGTFHWTGSASGTSVPTPTGLTAIPVASDQVDLSWNPSSGALGYDLERNGVVIALGIQGTTYSDTGLTADTEYTYRVRAVK